MTTPDSAEVWTKATGEQTRGHNPGLSHQWYCTHDGHPHDKPLYPAMLIAGDGRYRGDGVCLACAVKYLGKRP